MSLYLRLVIGPIVVCDIDLFATVDKPDPSKEPPPQLAGGTGTLAYPEPLDDEQPAVRRRFQFGYSAVPNGLPKPPPPPGRAAPSLPMVTGRCPEHRLTYCEPCGWVS